METRTGDDPFRRMKEANWRDTIPVWSESGGKNPVKSCGNVTSTVRKVGRSEVQTRRDADGNVVNIVQGRRGNRTIRLLEWRGYVPSTSRLCERNKAIWRRVRGEKTAEIGRTCCGNDTKCVRTQDQYKP